MNMLLENIEKLHTTQMGIERIKKNLQIETDDVMQWCKARILEKDTRIEQNRKVWKKLACNCRELHHNGKCA